MSESSRAEAAGEAQQLERALEAFRSHFGRRAEAAARAPGRVNLIGEHTDYNDGLVMPCAIDRDTLVVGSARDDGRLRVVSLDLDREAQRGLDEAPRRDGTDWSDYVWAPFAALEEAGHACAGADLLVTSRVPLESGLSSSAALTVATTLLLGRLFDLGLSQQEVAARAHRAESHFVGVGCGILDQWASALGQPGHALRIDCRTRSVEPVPWTAPAALLVARSGVTRALAQGGYADRLAECRAALEAARQARIGAPGGVRALRDLGPDDLPALEAALPGTLFRRARHVIRENLRVDDFCAAFRAGDLARAGRLLREGHASLRDDYQVSVPELDALCDLADALPGVHGSRLTGAGFGGCTLHLVDPGAAGAAAEGLRRGFEARFGRSPEPLVLRAGEGASALAP